MTTASLISAVSAASLRYQPNPSSKPFPTRGVNGWPARTVSNGSRAHCMKTWNPMNNRRFEALSYLPPLSEDSIAKEVDYMLAKGWVPCLEFDEVGEIQRIHSQIPGYYDGRYWTMWKLPMFGCTDSSQVLNEVEECKKTYPNAYVRLLAFNNQKQCQCTAIVVQKPSPASAA